MALPSRRGGTGLPRALLIATAVVSLLAGCAGAGRGPGDRVAGSGTSDPGGAPALPPGADALVLRLHELPGMLPPGGAAGIVPRYSLYADGRLITLVAGQGSWPALQVRRVPVEQVRDLLRTATEAGLPAGGPQRSRTARPDVPVTVVTVVSATQRRTGTLTSTDRAVRTVRDRLAGLAAAQSTPWTPDAVAVIAVPGGSGGPVRDWPLGPPGGQALSGLSAGSRCLILRGADLDAASRAAVDATAATTWHADGAVWTLLFRPLLPDEPGCAAL